MKYLLIAFIIIFIGCHPKIIQSTKTVIKDSVIYKIVEKRDTFKVKGDQVTITKLIPCDEAKPFTETKKSGRGSVTLSEDAKGNVSATAICDSIMQVHLREDTVTQHFHKETQTIHDTKEVFVTHWYDYWCRGIVLSGLIAFIIFAYLKIKKTVLPL